MLVGIAELKRVARSGRVGQPVFLRCTLQCEPARAEDVAAAALAAAAAVIGDRPRTLFARGEAASGSVHALLDFASGPTALVAVGPGEPAWDVMLLGNHGAAYLESARCAPANNRGRTTHVDEGPWVVRCWSSVVRRALAAGRPVPVEVDDE
jgi:hypothetical protein